MLPKFSTIRQVSPASGLLSSSSSVSIRDFSTIIGIESSCDDSACAVIDRDNVYKPIVNNNVFSQVELLAKFGGIDPKSSALEHNKVLPFIIRRSLGDIGVKYDVKTRRGSRTPETRPVDCIAVCAGPGLALPLRAGMDHAIDLSRSLDVPLVPVNHLEGHFLSPRLMYKSLDFPYLALSVSGGHTMLALVLGVGRYMILSQTVDDSIGEVFDKVARMLRDSSDVNTHFLRTTSEGRTIPVAHFGEALERIAQEAPATHEFKFRPPMEQGHHRGDLRERMKELSSREFELPQTDTFSYELGVSAFSFSGLKSGVRRALDAERRRLNPDLWALERKLIKERSLQRHRARTAEEDASAPPQSTVTVQELDSQLLSVQKQLENSKLPLEVVSGIADAFQSAAIAHLTSTVALALRFLRSQQALARASSAPAGSLSSWEAQGQKGMFAGAGLPSARRPADLQPTLGQLLNRKPALDIVVCGGVGRNKVLRSSLFSQKEFEGENIFFLDGDLCTDNGAMIAWAAHEYMRAGILNLSPQQGSNAKEFLRDSLKPPKIPDFPEFKYNAAFNSSWAPGTPFVPEPRKVKSSASSQSQLC